MGVFRRFILWDFGRETSIYVVFCLLIVAFIFLTPRSCFDSKERLATRTSRLIVKAEDFSADRDVLLRRVRELSGEPNAEIVETREKTNARGETIYEIEIR
ncbi:MAG TPA: hypothetical protein PKD24_07085 [Pyrinomonadaceae bacterium]|nr:hypothetical protein [Pyrinomonadaceae bacterium]HMP65077.1 hypothetical protein [Pyrinomonadaceae bacterium]